MEERKTTLADIKAKHLFENVTLAILSEVNPSVIYWILTGHPVARWQAIEVLKVLSMITKKDYNLDTVEVILRPEAVTEK